ERGLLQSQTVRPDPHVPCISRLRGGRLKSGTARHKDVAGRLERDCDLGAAAVGEIGDVDRRRAQDDLTAADGDTAAGGAEDVAKFIRCHAAARVDERAGDVDLTSADYHRAAAGTDEVPLIVEAPCSR